MRALTHAANAARERRPARHDMSPTRIAALTSLAMIAFACDSLRCRVALERARIDVVHGVRR